MNAPDGKEADVDLNQQDLGTLSASMPGSIAALIATKLMKPVPPRRNIRRDRLHRILEAGVEQKVTLVVAPAGFGKTSLVTSWLSSVSGPAVGWVSLDHSDNNPSRFYAYVLAALSLSGVCLPLPDDVGFQHGGAGAPEDLLAPLVNALAGLATDLILVLDDYQLITAPEIHRDVAFLIDQQLPRFHLIIIARSDPPFPLARSRANGHVIEVRARDLAFKLDEMTSFFHRQNIVLPPEVQTSLFERVEGWPAALRLISVWASGRDDLSSAIGKLTAGDATIADYITKEVLDSLPAELRRFLVLTSILPRLTGPLCDAVTGESNGEQMLRDLDHRGLFLERLVPSRGWFRYHPIFSEFLGLELIRVYPDLRAALHRRASSWFASQGLAADAIEHGLLSEDWTSVRSLILQETVSIGSRYHPSVIESWLAALPRPVLEGSPFFEGLYAFVLGNTGRLDDARAALDRADTLIELSVQDHELPELRALLSAMRAVIARFDCDLLGARYYAQEVEDDRARRPGPVGKLAEMAGAIAGNALATTMYWHGEVKPAAELLSRTERTAAIHRLPRMRASALSSTALQLVAMGHLRRAEAVATESLELARSVGVAGLFQGDAAVLALAAVSLQRADHPRASQQLTVVSERAGRQGDRAPRLAADTLRARLAALEGDVELGLAILDEARSAWPGWDIPPPLAAAVYEEEARLYLEAGDLPAARVVLARLQALPVDTVVVAAAVRMTAARLLRAEGSGAAVGLFGSIADAALSDGHLLRHVEAGIESAASARTVGLIDSAIASLEQAIVVAADEGMMGPFLSDAAAVRPLLVEIERRHHQHSRRGFRRRLLERMGLVTDHSQDAIEARSDVILSEREATVLRLLRGNLNNSEIAAALTVSPNTLKTHIRNIYRKLGANNRHQAIARARELGHR